MPSDPPNSSPSNSFGHILAVIAMFVVVVAGLKAASSILVPFLIAVFLTVLCAPIQARLMRRGLPQWLSLTLILVVLGGATVFVLVVVGSSVTGFTDNFDVYEQNLRAKRDDLITWISETLRIETDHASSIRQQLATSEVLGYLGRALTQLSSLLGSAAFILMMFAFMLAETPQLQQKGRRLADRTHFAMDEVVGLGHDIVHYFAIKAWISLGTGIALGLLYWVVGVDAPVLWAFVGFVLNFVPSIGSFLAAVPPLLLTLAQPGLGPQDTLLLLLGVVAINTVFGNIIEPRVMGKGLDLSTTVVLLSLLFWGWIFGPVGMLLSVPLTVACKLGLELDPRTRGLALFLGGPPK